MVSTFIARHLLLLLPSIAILSACGSFDDPTIVYDLRFLGAIAEPPEILLPADGSEIDLASLPEVKVCALFADPSDSRELNYALVACPPSDNGRCEEGQPFVRMGSGEIEDPEESNLPVRLCGTLGPSPELVNVIEESVSLDSLAGFGAIDIQVEISLWPRGDRGQTIYAHKNVRFGAALPIERVANTNPKLEALELSQVALGAAGLELNLTEGRCSDVSAPEISLGSQIDLLPVEAADAREDYVVPTLDGGSRAFRETLNYRFFSTSGDWTKGSTGGPRDISGNVATLDTSWTAPSDPLEVGDGLDVSLFVIQRDERGGQSWFQSCIRVVP